MTTYSTISNAALAVGAIPSSTTVTALRDNPLAMAEAASGAPINVMGWHPYDKVTVGDGKDGLIYSFAVSGSLTNVVSPDFEDGYEYRVFGVILGPGSCQLELYRETSAAYTAINPSLDTRYWFDLEFSMPRVPKASHLVFGVVGEGGTTVPTSYAGKVPNSPSTGFGSGSDPQKLLRFRFTSGTGTTAGKLWMFRRREFASSP